VINERGWQLVTRLRKSIELTPGAMSASIFEGRTWTLIEVGTATDDSVYSLALLLGLGPPKERRIAGSSGGYERWVYATGEQIERGRGLSRGLVKIDIIGPRRQKPAVVGAVGPRRDGESVTRELTQAEVDAHAKSLMEPGLQHPHGSRTAAHHDVDPRPYLATLHQFEGALYAAGWKLIGGLREIPGGWRATIQRGTASVSATARSAISVLAELLRSAQEHARRKP